MKEPIILFMLTALISFKPADPLPIGASLPKGDLQLNDISGKQITLRESIGANGLLVMFSCNTCPVVVANQGRTVQVSQNALKNNIGVVLLNSNEADRNGKESLKAMKAYAGEHKYAWHYAEDKNSVLADAFGANRTPECFLFDKNGKLVYHGAIDDSPQDGDRVNRNHLTQAIEELINGKEISVKKSRSVGCSIKRN